MTENPLVKALDRLTRIALAHGTAYCRVTWDADKQVFNFTSLLPEHVTVHYGEKKHD